MLKLLIADDEKYDRDSIISMLHDKFREEIEICEARNGREAIELSESFRPEIIIMDIKMPGINGLKAIQEIKKFLPDTYFIILTAYDYFDFALEAVKNNVKEYILKPFSKSELMDKIGEGINFVNNIKEKRKKDIENQEKLFNLIPVLENELCYSIINDSLQSIDFETFSKYLDFDFQNTCSMVLKIKDKPTIGNTNEAILQSIRVNIGEYVKEYLERSYRTIASYRFTKELIYFIQLKNFRSYDEARLDIVNLGSNLRRDLKKQFDVSVRIGIGTHYSGPKLMNKSYREACECLEYKSDMVNIVHYGDISVNNKENEFINERLQNMDRGKVAIFKAVEQYITSNISEDLDLEKTAAKFNLSSYYFSRTFKEVLGCNFSNYVNIIRVSKAKELLKNDVISIKEVCYLVGYSDPNYFSKVFKKYEGLCPSDFKAKLG